VRDARRAEHPHLSAAVLAEPGDDATDPLDALVDAAELLVQQARLPGRHQPALLAREEAEPGAVLEQADQAGRRGLTDGERARRGGHRAVEHQRPERLDLAQIHGRLRAPAAAPGS
jgi:hypothetical protein